MQFEIIEPKTPLTNCRITSNRLRVPKLESNNTREVETRCLEQHPDSLERADSPKGIKIMNNTLFRRRQQPQEQIALVPLKVNETILQVGSKLVPTK